VAECIGVECFSWLRAGSSGEDGTENLGLQKTRISRKIERCLKETFFLVKIVKDIWLFPCLKVTSVNGQEVNKIFCRRQNALSQ
jgi:hypothetical protein